MTNSARRDLTLADSRSSSTGPAHPAGLQSLYEWPTIHPVATVNATPLLAGNLANFPHLVRLARVGPLYDKPVSGRNPCTSHQRRLPAQVPFVSTVSRDQSEAINQTGAGTHTGCHRPAKRGLSSHSARRAVSGST